MLERMPRCNPNPSLPPSITPSSTHHPSALAIRRPVVGQPDAVAVKRAVWVTCVEMGWGGVGGVDGTGQCPSPSGVTPPPTHAHTHTTHPPTLVAAVWGCILHGHSRG